MTEYFLHVTVHQTVSGYILLPVGIMLLLTDVIPVLPVSLPVSVMQAIACLLFNTCLDCLPKLRYITLFWSHMRNLDELLLTTCS